MSGLPEDFDPRRILIACDKFKHALAADEVCEAVAAGLADAARFRHALIERVPLTDGGDGFAALLTDAVRGVLVEKAAEGPLGLETPFRFGLIEWDTIPEPARAVLDLPSSPGWVAVVEMASLAGIALLDESDRDPWVTHTRGVGQALELAAGVGAEAVVLGIGGSATQDLGLGALSALGLKAFDRQGNPLDASIPASWEAVETLDATALRSLPPLRIACDVDHPLLGSSGSAAVFGPQKGLPEADVPRLDAAAERMAGLLLRTLERPLESVEEPGAGAAGGLGFGLRAAYGARFVPGFDLVSAWLRLPERIGHAAWVISGEGGFDTGSLRGKGPGAILKLAQNQGKRCGVVAGRIDDRARREVEKQGWSWDWVEVTPRDQPLDEALPRTARNIRKRVADLCRHV